MMLTPFTPIFSQINLHQPQIMGILNVTPDSFSDGGRYTLVARAVQQALKMEQEGARFIDIGGESTRPNAIGVGEQQELDRVLPVLEALRQESAVMISIDTSSPKLMLEAAKLGANLLNDVRSFTRKGALDAAVATGLPICIMHMRGEPSSMQQQTHYLDVIKEVTDWLAQRMQACVAAGVAKERIVLDPGFGFAKRLPHNLALLANLNKLQALGSPLLVGMSRKRMLGEITGKPALERDAAGIAAHLLAAQQGASILRVHSVAGLNDALQVWQAVQQAAKSI